MEYLLYLQRNSDLITQNKGIDALNLLLDKHPKDDEIDLAVRLYILYISYILICLFIIELQIPLQYRPFIGRLSQTVRRAKMR